MTEQAVAVADPDHDDDDDDEFEVLPVGIPPEPQFIYYLNGPRYREEMLRLSAWVQELLIPVYGQEETSAAPWCAQWWLHPAAVAQLHGLALAWRALTGPGSDATGPATWHRDYLGPVMAVLRDPSGPFAGCKGGRHRTKKVPDVAVPPV